MKKCSHCAREIQDDVIKCTHCNKTQLTRDEVFGWLYAHLYDSLGYVDISEDFAYFGSWVNSNINTGLDADILPHIDFDDDNTRNKEIRAFWKYSKERASREVGSDVFIPDFLSPMLLNLGGGEMLRTRELECIGIPNIFVIREAEDVEHILAIAYGATVMGHLNDALNVLADLTHVPSVGKMVPKAAICVLANYLIPALAKSEDRNLAMHSDTLATAFSYYLMRGENESYDSSQRLLNTFRFNQPQSSHESRRTIAELIEGSFKAVSQKYEAEIYRHASAAERKKAEDSVLQSIPEISDYEAKHALMAAEIFWQKFDDDTVRFTGDLSMGIVEYAKAVEAMISSLWDAIIERHKEELNNKTGLWKQIERLEKEKFWKKVVEKCRTLHRRSIAEVLQLYLGSKEMKSDSFNPTAVERYKMLKTLVSLDRDGSTANRLVSITEDSMYANMKTLFYDLRNGYAHESVLHEPYEAQSLTKKARELSYDIINTVIQRMKQL